MSASSDSYVGKVLDKCAQQITADNIAPTCDSLKSLLKYVAGVRGCALVEQCLTVVCPWLLCASGAETGC